METIDINGTKFNVIEDRFTLGDKAPQDCTMEEVLAELRKVDELFKEGYLALKVSVTNCINQFNQHKELVEKFRAETDRMQQIKLLPELEASLKKLCFLVGTNRKCARMTDPAIDLLRSIDQSAKHVPVRTADDVLAAHKMRGVMHSIFDTQKKRHNCALALHDVANEAPSLRLG